MINGPFKPVNSMVDIEKAKASIPTVDRSTIEKQVNNPVKTQDQIEQRISGEIIADAIGGDKQNWANFMEDTIPDVSAGFWGTVKNFAGTPFRAIDSIDAILDPEAYNEKKRLERENIINQNLNTEYQKQESNIGQRLSKEFSDIDTEEKKIQAQIDSLDPMSTDYFRTKKILSSKKIDIQTKKNLLIGENNKYLKQISIDVKPKEFSASPIKSFFQDEDVGNQFLNHIKKYTFNEDGSHKATEKLLNGDSEGARIEGAKERISKQTLQSVMGKLYEIAGDKVKSGLAKDTDSYLNSPETKSRLDAIMGSIGSILEKNPNLIDKNTGEINAQEYDKLKNADSTIQKIFSELETEGGAYKVSSYVEKIPIGVEQLKKGDILPGIYNIGGGLSASIIEMFNQDINQNRADNAGDTKVGYFGAPIMESEKGASDKSLFGKSDVRELNRSTNLDESGMFGDFINYVRSNPADIIGVVGGLKAATSSANILSRASQPKYLRKILAGVDDVIKGFPLNLGIYGKTGDYTPGADIGFDFMGGYFGSVKKVAGIVDEVANETVRIAKSKGEKEARRYLLDNGLKFVSADVTDKSSIVDARKMQVEMFDNPKSQIAIQNYNKFVGQQLDDLDAGDIDFIASSVRRSIGTIGKENATKIFGNVVADITEAAKSGDIDTVKRIAKETYQQMNSNQIQVLLQNNIDQIKINTMQKYLTDVLSKGAPKNLPEEVMTKVNGMLMMGSDDVSSLKNMKFFKENPGMLNKTASYMTNAKSALEKGVQLTKEGNAQLSKELGSAGNKVAKGSIERNYSSAVKDIVGQFSGGKSINSAISSYPGKKISDRISKFADDIIEKSGVRPHEGLKKDIVNYVTMRQNMSSSDAMIGLSKSKSASKSSNYENLKSFIDEVAGSTQKSKDPFAYSNGIPNDVLEAMSKAEDDIIKMVSDPVKYSTEMKQGLRGIIKSVASIGSPEGVRTVSSLIKGLYDITLKNGGDIYNKTGDLISKSIDIIINDSEVDIIKKMQDVLYKDGVINSDAISNFAKNYNMDYDSIMKIELEKPGEGLRALLINKIKTDAMVKATSGVKLSTAKKYSSIESFSDILSDIVSESIKIVSSVGGKEDDIYDTIFHISSPSGTSRKVMDLIAVGKEYLRHLILGDATGTNQGIMHISSEVMSQMGKSFTNFVSIPSSYLIGAGRQMLEESIGYSNFTLEQVNRFNKAIESALKKRSAASQVGILKIYKNFFKDGSLLMNNGGSSLISILEGFVDTRKSVSSKKGMGGVIFRPVLDLFKFTLIEDFDGGKKILKNVVDNYFDRAIISGSMQEGDVVRFAEKMGLSNPSEAFIKLYDEVVTSLGSAGISMSKIHDDINPLIYSVDDYIKAIIESPLNGTDTVLGLLNRRNHLKGYENMSSHLDGLSKKLGELNFSDSGFEYRNYTSHLMEESAKSILKGVDSLPISKDSMYRYLYRELGGNLGHSFMGDSTNALSHRLQLTIDSIMDSAKKNMGIDKMPDFEKRLGEIIDETIYRVEEGITKANSEGEEIGRDLAKVGLDKMKVLVGELPDSDRIVKDIDDISNQFGNDDPTWGTIESIMRRILQDKPLPESTKIGAAEYLAGSEDRLILQDVINRGENKTTQEKIVQELYTSDSTDTLEKMLIAEGRSNEEIKELTQYAKKLSKGAKEGKLLDPEEALEMINRGASIWDIVEANPGFRRGLKKFVQDTASLEEEGNILIMKGGTNFSTEIRNKTNFGWKIGADWMNLVLNPANIVTPTTLAIHDPELAGIMNKMNFMNTQPLTVVEGSQFVFEDKKTKGLGEYRNLAYNKMMKMVSGKWGGIFSVLKESELKAMHDQLTLGTAAKFDMVPERARDLYANIVSYMTDINEFRINKGLGPKTYAEVFSSNGVGQIQTMNANNILRTLTGKWTELSNDDIVRIGKKYGDVKTFQESMLWGALYHKGTFGQEALKGAMKFMTTVTIQKMFGLWGNATKGLQQVASGYAEAEAFIKSTGMDEEVIERIWPKIYESLNFNLLKGDRALSGASSTTASSVFQSFTNLTSALTWGDKLIEPKAAATATALALEEYVKRYGDEFLEQFDKKSSMLKSFISENGYRSESEFASGFGSKKAQEIYDRLLSEKGKDVAEQFSKDFDELRSFYINEYRPITQKSRAYQSAFYVSDNIPEYNFTPIVQRNKNSFGLMKWSLNKFGDYTIRIGEAFDGAKGLSGSAYVEKILSHPVWMQVAKQMSIGFKFNNYIDGLTNDGEGNSFDNKKKIVVGLVAPAAAFSMLIGDQLIESWNKGSGVFDRTQEWDKAIAAGLLEFGLKTMERSLIYEDKFMTDWVKSIKTQSEIDRTTTDESFFVGVLMDQWRSLFSGWERFSKINVSGMKFDTIVSDKIAIAEYLTNTESGPRSEFRDQVNRMYGAYDYESVFNGNNIKSRIPVAGVLIADGQQNNGTYQGIVKDYIDKSGFSSLFYEYAEPSAVNSILDKINLYGMTANPEAKKIKDLTPEIAVEKKILKETSTVWDTIMGNDGKYDDAMDIMIFGNASDKRVLELKQYWEKRIAGDKELGGKKAKAYKPKDLDFEEFVADAERLGGQATIKEYTEAYYKSYREALSNHLLGKGKYEANKNVNSPQYVEFVKIMNDLSTQLIKDNWHALGREKTDGVSLANKLMSVDPNMPIKKYQKEIGSQNSNLSMATTQMLVNKIGENEGYGKEYLGAYAFMATKAASIVSSLPTSEVEDIEKQKKAMGNLTGLMLDVGKSIEENSDNPVKATIGKMSMATGLMPFINKLNSIDPDGLKLIMDSVGKENIERVVNMFTDSMPVDMKTAYALVTGDDTDPDGKGKGKGKKMGSLGAIEKKQYKSNLPEILLNNYKKAVEGASKLPSRGFNLSPTKFTYEPNKKGELIETKINIPRATTQEVPDNGGGGTTVRGKTRIDPISVKKSKVMTTTNTIKKLPKSAISSRRISI